MKKNIFGFTLPELLVGLAILVFLSTIGYIKYSDYISDSRDTTRFSKINEISDLIKAYKISHTLPVPLDFVEIRANSKVIGYQGYAGPDILEKIHYSSEGRDPNDYTYFSYFITTDRKFFELMGFYENDASLNFSSFFNKTYAKKIDYSIRYPYVSGDSVGIYTAFDKTPVQEVDSYITAGEVDLSGTNKDEHFNVYFSNKRVYSFSGSILASKMYTVTHRGQFGDPNNCPEGYISVWGDIDFNQKGFCVAKYEMTFSELDSPLTPTNSNVNGYNYVSGKYYKSRPDYPVVKVSQAQAIEACNRLGKGYHLITNNEWMTIARQIEFERENWKNKLGGFGDGIHGDTLYNGNSSDTFMLRGCSDDTGPNGEITKTGDGDQNCFHKRKNYLFNGEIIWDFAGNVAEHVNKANTKSGSGFDNGRTKFYKSDGSSPNNTWEEFQDLDETIRPNYGPNIGEDGSNGVGLIYDFNGINNNVFIRGGSFQDDYSAGIYTLSLDMKGDWDSDYVGFRCAR